MSHFNPNSIELQILFVWFCCIFFIKIMHSVRKNAFRNLPYHQQLQLSEADLESGNPIIKLFYNISGLLLIVLPFAFLYLIIF